MHVPPLLPPSPSRLLLATLAKAQGSVPRLQAGPGGDTFRGQLVRWGNILLDHKDHSV